MSGGEDAARRIGVISDTHDLLRPEALQALQGSDLILHAGDICGPEVLQALWQIAHGTPQVQMISAPQQILNLRVTPDQVGSVQKRD